MGFANSAVILAIALVLGACAHVPRWGKAPRPVESGAQRLGHGQASNDLVVLLPKATGSVGAVVVRSADAADVILDKPYAAALIEGAGHVQPLTYNADRAKKEFGAALNALPARPVTYL